MSSYFVKTKRDGRTQGPFTPEQLKALAAGGKLKPHYLVSRDRKKWYIAKNIRDLPAPEVARPATSAVDLAAQAAAQHRPPARAVPGDAKRFPAVLIGGLVCALSAVVAITAYFLYVGDGTGDDEADADLLALIDAHSPGGGTSGTATGGTGGTSSGTSTDTPAGTSPQTHKPGTDESTPQVHRPTPDRPPPRPRGKFEPLKPPGSFQVLSVKYGGQVVRAMGSQLTFVLTNISGKDIQSVKGHIRLYDPSGSYLVGLPVEIAEPIKAGAAITKKGVWLEVLGLTLAMLDESSDEMKFKFAADEVTYEDGEVKKF